MIQEIAEVFGLVVILLLIVVGGMATAWLWRELAVLVKRWWASRPGGDK